MACNKCGAKRGHLPGCDDWGIPTTQRKRRRGHARGPEIKRPEPCKHKRTRNVERKGKTYVWCTDCHNWIGGSP